jgi:prepilin-type N-terminal cleavage/methylation domain-containing protein
MKKLFLFRLWKLWKCKYTDLSLGKAAFGFTLIEMLVVLAIVGVLSAIVGPTWLGSLNRQRLNSSQGQVFRAIRLAQSNAKRDKVNWQVTFRNSPVDGTAQISVHKAFTTTPTAAEINTLPWESVASNVVIKTSLTTAIPLGCTSYCAFRFDAKGQPDRGLNDVRRVTLSYGSQAGSKACVFVSTLIGAVRTDFDTGCD